MIYCGEAPAVMDENVQGAGDEISIKIHGLTNTHLDAICHVSHNGLGFNGHLYTQMVTMQDGARYAAIDETGAVITRGVLVDIPRRRGVAYLEPGEPVGVQELREATPDLHAGDALLVRTGRWLAPVEMMDDRSVDPHGRYSGLHPECMWYIAERDVAILGTDGPGDNFPSPISECHLSIHVLAEAYLGLPLIHNMDLEALAVECAAEARNSFLFCLAPLRIVGGTGSPVTPIAVL
jgi:kynurenine formamidase